MTGKYTVCRRVRASFSPEILHAWAVKRFSSKRISLKADVIGPENILFAGASVHLSAQKLYRLGQWRG